MYVLQILQIKYICLSLSSLITVCAHHGTTTRVKVTPNVLLGTTLDMIAIVTVSQPYGRGGEGPIWSECV